MAQYAVLIIGTDSAHAPDATEEDLDVHTRHADELIASGVMVAAFALTSRDMATTVREDMITDGPFLDSKEVVAGFYVIEAPDLDAALAIAKRNDHRGAGRADPAAGVRDDNGGHWGAWRETSTIVAARPHEEQG